MSSDDPNSPGYYAPDVSALRKMYRPSVAVAPPSTASRGGLSCPHVQVSATSIKLTETRANVLPALSWAPRGMGKPTKPHASCATANTSCLATTPPPAKTRAVGCPRKTPHRAPRGVSTRDRPQRSTHRQGLLRLLAQRTTPAVASFRRRPGTGRSSRTSGECAGFDSLADQAAGSWPEPGCRLSRKFTLPDGRCTHQKRPPLTCP